MNKVWSSATKWCFSSNWIAALGQRRELLGPGGEQRSDTHMHSGFAWKPAKFNYRKWNYWILKLDTSPTFLVGETMGDEMYGVKCRGCFRYMSQEAEQIRVRTAESWARVQILGWQAHVSVQHSLHRQCWPREPTSRSNCVTELSPDEKRENTWLVPSQRCRIVRQYFIIKLLSHVNTTVGNIACSWTKASFHKVTEWTCYNEHGKPSPAQKQQETRPKEEVNVFFKDWDKS